MEEIEEIKIGGRSRASEEVGVNEFLARLRTQRTDWTSDIVRELDIS